LSEHHVFFFGAGASKAEGGLLTSELLLEALKHPNVDQRYQLMIERFLNELFRTEKIDDVDSIEQLPSFEELLTLVDVALLKQEEFSSYWNKARLFKLREALVYCVAWILKTKLQSSSSEPTPQYHKLFVENIFGNGTNIEANNNSFISLNYDILLDSALMDLYPRWDVDYCINFRNFTTTLDWNKPRSAHEIKLLKLHGSLNWMLCPVCNSVRLNPGGKIADRIIADKTPCELDRAAQCPLLIPPTWLKVYDCVHLAKIWLEAEHILRNASRVFFIGYSLPESDFHVRYLLKKSLYRKRKAPKITIITSPRNQEGSKLHLRYKRFFGQVGLYPVGFETFSMDAEKYVYMDQ